MTRDITKLRAYLRASVDIDRGLNAAFENLYASEREAILQHFLQGSRRKPRMVSVLADGYYRLASYEHNSRTYIEDIKWVRATAGWSLKEAKEFVDGHVSRTEMSKETAEKFQGRFGALLQLVKP